jgi:hypothetical protein
MLIVAYRTKGGSIMFVNMGSKSMVVLGVIIGLLLLVIGNGTGHQNVSLAGQFIFPIALIWGGLSVGEENVPLRVALLSLGGLFVIAAFASSFSLASLITGR